MNHTERPRMVCPQPFPYRIMEGEPVTREQSPEMSISAARLSIRLSYEGVAGDLRERLFVSQRDHGIDAHGAAGG
jgi:hypothetical protein